MIREAEAGRGTSEYVDQHELDNLENYDFLEQLEHAHDPEISFVFRSLQEENNSCGSDEYYVNNKLEEYRNFYFGHISVSQESAKRIFSLSIGQDNFHWRKERQVSFGFKT